MVYSDNEKEMMDALIAAFRSYIRQHPYFDMVYSEKAGYLRLILRDDTVIRISGFEELLKTLIDDMVADEEESRAGEVDLENVRAVLLARFSQMGQWEPLCKQLTDRYLTN